MSEQVKSTSDEVVEIKEEANEELPIPEEDKTSPTINKAFQDEQGRIIARVNKESNRDEIHPMSRGVRAAKATINEILKNSDNLKKLHLALQTEFDKDPVNFLMKFEPLLEKYEKLSSDHREKDGSVSLFVRDGKTQINIGRKDEN